MAGRRAGMPRSDLTDLALSGAIQLPDGSWVRGRGLRNPAPDGPAPEYGLYLGGSKLRRAHQMPWPHEWIDWPDFLVPRDFDHAVGLIRALHGRALAGERIEVACGGGVGRTGTVVACLAVLAGHPAADAVNWARANYHRRAVEMPWQRKWIARFAAQ
jgi:protein-tyrosine phosphatase